MSSLELYPPYTERTRHHREANFMVNLIVGLIAYLSVQKGSIRISQVKYKGIRDKNLDRIPTSSLMCRFPNKYFHYVIGKNFDNLITDRPRYDFSDSLAPGEVIINI